MKSSRKFRIYDYISLMIIAFSAFNLLGISYLAFGYGCVIVFASLSLCTLLIDNKK